MPPLLPGESQIDSVKLMHLASGQELRGWTQYSLDRKFLTPTDAWSFTFADELGALRDVVKGGDKVQILVNDYAQCTGYVERIEQEGSVVTLTGRDILGPVIDSYVDPHLKFAKTMTVRQCVEQVVAPFGISTVEASDSANLNALTGTGVGYPSRPELATLTLEQAKPKPGEGAHQFLKRILERQGLYLWAKGDGSGIVVDKPSFDTPALTVVTHRTTGGEANNVLRASMTKDFLSQPSCVVAWGHGGGSEKGHTRTKSIVVNDLIPATPELAAILAAPDNAGAVKQPPIPKLVTYQGLYGSSPLSRPLYVEDKDCKNQAQLDAFARRIMAEQRAKALQLRFTVLGHSFVGVPWNVNTMVQVVDEDFGITDVFWCSGRTFRKSRSGGTTTDLELLLPYALEF